MLVRTLQVVNVRWYNATAWYGVSLAHALSTAGHESLVVGLPGTPPLAQAEALGLPVVGLPLNGLPWPRLLNGMHRVLKSFRPDVVNCHRGESFVLWALLQKQYGYSLVRTRGDQRLPKNNGPNRWLHRRADAVIATNSAMARHFTSVLGVPKNRVHVVLGGVDTSRFYPNAEARARLRQAYGFDDTCVVIGLVGRLDTVKGQKQAIAALNLACQSLAFQKNLAAEVAGPCPFRLLLVGFDSEFSAADVHSWAARHGVEDQVVLSGKVERPEEWINAFDLGLLASLGSETIARAALEIMACGVPLISSRVGVMPDLLPDEYLFQPGNVEEMVPLLLKSLDPAWREQVRQVCRQKIATLSLNDFLQQSLHIYTESKKN